MPDRQTDSLTKYFLYAVRGVAIFLVTLVFKTVTNIQVVSMSQNEDIMRQLDSAFVVVFYLVGALAVWLIYGTITYILTLYDHDAQMRFLAKQPTRVAFFGEFRTILTSFDYLIETSVAVFIFFIGAHLGAFFETERVFAIAGVSEGYLRTLLSMINLPILAFISAYQRYEVHRYWLELHRIGDLEKLRSPIRLALHFCALFLYPLLYPYALLPLYMFMTIAGIAAVFTRAFGIIGITVFLLVILIFFVARPAMKRRSAKRKFMKRLLEVAAESGYTVEIIPPPADGTRRAHFSISKDGKSYYVRYVDTLRRGVPLYFTSQKNAYFLHRLGTKRHHISFSHHFEYDFDAPDGADKLLVIIRYPKRVYASEGRAARPIVGGDRIWGYTVFEPETLIGYVDRKCLGRYNGMFD